MAAPERFLRIASALVDVEDNRYNLIAIVVQGGSILSIGINDMDRTHPVYFQQHAGHDHGIHAEYDAIRKLKGADLTDAKMYVFRFRKDGLLGDSKPCRHCRKILKEAKLGRVFYFQNGGMKELWRGE